MFKTNRESRRGLDMEIGIFGLVIATMILSFGAMVFTGFIKIDHTMSGFVIAVLGIGSMYLSGRKISGAFNNQLKKEEKTNE